MSKRVLGLLVAVGLLAGCGKQSSVSQLPSPAAPTSGSVVGTLLITQQGAAPAKTVWYARIETMNAEPVAQAGFPAGPIALTRDLPAGKYRAMSWHRACSATCPASGEEGLGPLQEVCGAPVTLNAGARITLTVVIDPEGTCTIQ